MMLALQRASITRYVAGLMYYASRVAAISCLLDLCSLAHKAARYDDAIELHIWHSRLRLYTEFSPPRRRHGRLSAPPPRIVCRRRRVVERRIRYARPFPARLRCRR